MKKDKLLTISVIVITTITAAVLSYYDQFLINTPQTNVPAAAKTDPVKRGVFTFPNDHYEHKSSNTEWWYLNLLVQVKDTSGKIKNVGYLVSFSRISNNYGLLTSRYTNDSDKFAEKTNIGPVTISPSTSPFKISYNKSGARMEFAQSDNSNFTLKGSTSQIGTLDLKLKSNNFNNPLLWGCTGNISVFSKNDTNYYSVPNFEVTGKIVDIDGKTKPIVLGKAWLDHQWFSSKPPTDWKGHYWMNIHTDKNTDLAFVTQVYKSGNKYTYWVKNDNGKLGCGTSGTLTITDKFKNGYPSQASLNIDKDNQFVIDILSDNQIFTPPVGPAFTEPVFYSSGGKISGKAFKDAFGFFETHIK